MKKKDDALFIHFRVHIFWILKLEQEKTILSELHLFHAR